MSSVFATLTTNRRECLILIIRIRFLLSNFSGVTAKRSSNCLLTGTSSCITTAGSG